MNELLARLITTNIFWSLLIFSSKQIKRHYRQQKQSWGDNENNLAVNEPSALRKVSDIPRPRHTLLVRSAGFLHGWQFIWVTRTMALE